MPVFALPNACIFPDIALAEPDGLLAVGGDLTTTRLREAYRVGIFPWSDSDEQILWWSPDPRLVLFPGELKVSSSMRRVLKQGCFRVTADQAFDDVIAACRETVRPDQDGTWITDGMVSAYRALHREGHAHSIEVWQDDTLVGGLYGISIGKAFFGESMFTRVSNASKAGFITLVRFLEREAYVVIDCQVHSPHLASLGAREIPRHQFREHLDDATSRPALPGPWTDAI